ncbi:hypothetical protein NMG60_11036190 [Bertholletia excelsa]
MEYWRDPSEGKSPLLCDMGLPGDTLGRTSKESMQWSIRPSSKFDNMLSISKEAIERVETIPNMIRKSDPGYAQSDCLVVGIGHRHSFRQHSPPSMITPNSSFGDLGSIAGPSIVSNHQKSTLIDLKLGDLADRGEAKNSGAFHERPAGISLVSKRARVANLYSENPVCIVQGCSKDLTSAKDYYRRHKVCDVHSKTARVIVNGIEQRFCQQCSRFHLLAEFDDGKRSCRKRLAGHNERRRKPQLDVLSGMGPLQGSLAKGPAFVFPDMPIGGIFSAQSNVQGNLCGHIKLEKGQIHCPAVAKLTMNRRPYTNPVFHLQGLDRQYTSEILSSRTGYTLLERAATVQELYGLTSTRSALSLLSARSTDLSSPLTGIPMASHLLDRYGVDQCSENPGGVRIGEKFSTNGFCYSRVEVDPRGPSMIFDASDNIDFEVQASVQKSDAMRSQTNISPDKQGVTNTVDLVQLSLHLQRVEQQRNSMQVMKQENDAFSSFPNM